MVEYISLGGNCCIAYNLKKYNKSVIRFPFDWCNITINQLNNVLSNDFNNFTNIEIKKLSKNHNLLVDQKLSIEPSLILSNNYNIKFSHEIIEKYQLENFVNILNKRVERFYNLKDPIFIRIELQSKSIEYYQLEYTKLILNLKKYVKNFKLILIINLKYRDLKLKGNVNIFYFTDYISNWKYENLDWSNIFNDN